MSENGKNKLEDLESPPPEPPDIVTGDPDNEESSAREKYTWGPVSVYHLKRVVPDLHPWRTEEPAEKFYKNPEDPEEIGWMSGVAIPEPWDKVRRILNNNILPFTDRPTDEHPAGRFPPRDFPHGFSSIEPDEKCQPFLLSFSTTVNFPRIADRVNMYVGHPDAVAFGFLFLPFTSDPSEEWPPEHTNLFCWWYVNPDPDRYGHPLARMEFGCLFREWVLEKAVELMGGEGTREDLTPLPWEDPPLFKEFENDNKFLEALKNHLKKYKNEHGEVWGEKGFPQGTLKQIYIKCDPPYSDSRLRQEIVLKRL